MADEKLAAAATTTLNMNNTKDREIRMIELLEEQVKYLKYIAANTAPKYNRAKKILLKVKGSITGITKEKDMNLLLGENAEITVDGIVDEAGNPAAVEGDKLNWSVSGDQDLGELQVAADGKSALFVRNGKTGTCAVEVRGDADLGPDEDIIVGSLELVCLGGKAVKFQMTGKAVPAAAVA